VVDRETLQPFAVLVLFAGIALVLSVPWTERVGDWGRSAFAGRFPIFFAAQAFLLGTLGLSLGAASAARREPRREAAKLLLARTLLGQFVTLPYVLFARALFPTSGESLALILGHAAIVALAAALGSRILEEPTRRRLARAHPSKYLLFLAYCLVPLPTPYSVVSPLGLAAGLLAGVGWRPLLLAFSIPSAAAGLLLIPALRRQGGE